MSGTLTLYDPKNNHLPLHQERGQKHGKPGQAWPGQACQSLGRASQESVAWKSLVSPVKARVLR